MDSGNCRADPNDILGIWGTNGSTQKSAKEINSLADMLRNGRVRGEDINPNFDLNHWAQKQDKLDNATEEQPFRGFSEATVRIPVPSGQKLQPGEETRLVDVPGLYCRKLTSLIRDVFAQPLADKFHFTPYQVFRETPSAAADAPETQNTERVYSELYNSEEFIMEHDRVQRLDLHPDDAGCNLERVVAGLMFWSDSTHLADFGTAKMWPVYMFMGNLSKYERARPTSGACHHLAYIPSLPDSFQDSVKASHAKWDTQKTDILAHCRRELMHAVWRHILDDDFMHAYQYGMVIMCRDGIRRRVYPRLFSYSADYPEKVLLATIRDKGLCPCPRCLAPKNKVDCMGQVNDLKQRQSNARNYARELVDTTRDWIYRLGYGVRSAAVETMLKPTSSVPTQNAFADRLNIEPANILVVDLMHEFELGVWKALFTHLVRLLYAAEPHGSLVEKFDER
ncbi:hypothetical protein FISHEDRAFT_44304 [Fistulina hepatica ATCC 64428]|uniref:Uncharacterized protein n=1 Tax=Fistulina hepatica ATCC 64428 TaxID=1128425 RepID=A0A0D7AAV1_9AGAR|nr:hypothetical protein FISHEDRAFT_44304 [Fistulina hepatica ATCC 64428]